MPANQEIYGLVPIQTITGTAAPTAMLPFTYDDFPVVTRGNIVIFTNTGATNAIYIKVVIRGAPAPTVTATDYEFLAGAGDGHVFIPFSADRCDFYVFSSGSTFTAKAAGY